MTSPGAASMKEISRQYAGRTVLVVGAARSGLAAAELLLSIGAKVILNDSKPASALAALPPALEHPSCTLAFGQNALALLDEADYVMISPGIPITAPIVMEAEKRGIPLLGELAFAASLCQAEIIAVSGTNGKTTTVSLLGEIFRQAGRVVHVAGNIGYPLSSAVLRARPEDIIIAEVSSFQLETSGEFHPRIGVMLNITPDHLDRHRTMENYVGLKKKLFEKMGSGDAAVLNWDDLQVRAMADSLNTFVFWFSRLGAVTNGAQVMNHQLAWVEHGEARPVCALSDLKIPGKHNVENALAALTAAASFGVPLPVIAYAMKVFQGVEHRIEYVDTFHGVAWLNDSKGTNPDSTVKAVESMQAPTVLIAGGYDKQVPFDSLAAAVVSSGQVHDAVLIGQTAEKIKQALNQAGFHNTFHAATLEEAVQTASRLARDGGNVLFSPACASFDMFTDYEQRGRIFKDLVKQLKDGEG